MRRVNLCIAAVALVFAVGCSDDVSSPTSPSNQAGGSTPTPQPGCSAPNAPAGLQVTQVAGTTVSLAWSASGGATQYLILVGTSQSSSNTLSTNTTNTNYTWGGVQPGTHYARVQAKNACGTSGSSNEVQITVVG